MRKYLKINAAQEHVLQSLIDVDKWPEWWPNYQSATVLEERDGGFTADLSLDIKIGGKMVIDVDFSRAGVVVIRQIKGWFKTYSNTWTLLPDQQGTGTTIKILVEVAAGPLVSKRMLHEKVSQSLDQAENNLNHLLRGLAQPSAGQTAGTAADAQAQARQKPIHVFPTAKGVEVWLAGRRYLLKYAGWGKEPANFRPDS